MHDLPPCGQSTGGTDRRTFLKTGALATSAMALGAPLQAAPRRPRRPVTVVLFQRGGADMLTLVAPTGDPNYAALRPTIAVAAPGNPGTVVGLPMNQTFSLHPALAGLHAAYTAPNSRVAFVHAVGHVPYDRSHFESQDLFETGALGGLTDGWINRHLQATAGAKDAPVRALALRGSLPRSLAGAYPCYAVASTADLQFRGRLPDMRATLQAIVGNTATAGMGTAAQQAYGTAIDAFELIDLFSVLSPSTYVPANGASYPATGLGRNLREAAELIKAGLGVEFVVLDQGGWDHHSGLLSRIATYAADFDQAVTAFFTDLGVLGDEVVLVSMSEFGREVRENGSAGTDHGVGGAMVLAGGPVRGGAVHGVWPGLAPAALQDGRFLAPRNDFRNVLLEILEQHMGGSAADAVFPDLSYAPLGVV